MARPRKYTASQVALALKEAKGLTSLAAARLGCSSNTVRRYCQRHPSVQAAKDAERGAMLDLAELKLWQAISNGEPWAVVFCLTRLGKDRGYSLRVEHTGSSTEPITIKVVYEEQPHEHP